MVSKKLFPNSNYWSYAPGRDVCMKGSRHNETKRIEVVALGIIQQRT